MDDFFDNKLKMISTETLERAIANAIRDLNGVEYSVKIKSIEYDIQPFFGSGEINLVIHQTERLKGSGDIVGNG